jgi:hypothetical protein
MIWWFLIIALAAGAVLWAVLSAAIWVRQRLRNAENEPVEPEHSTTEPREDYVSAADSNRGPA